MNSGWSPRRPRPLASGVSIAAAALCVLSLLSASDVRAAERVVLAEDFTSFG